jgi:hypothetical protein
MKSKPKSKLKKKVRVKRLLKSQKVDKVVVRVYEVINPSVVTKVELVEKKTTKSLRSLNSLHHIKSLLLVTGEGRKNRKLL